MYTGYVTSAIKENMLPTCIYFVLCVLVFLYFCTSEVNRQTTMWQPRSAKRNKEPPAKYITKK